MLPLLAAGVLVAPIINWLLEVNKSVDEPYLDEVFHVRQAQHYCNGDFHIWDPKITTPPGLYIVSTLLSKIPFLGCELAGFRLHVLLCMGLLALVLYAINGDRRQSAKQTSQKLEERISVGGLSMLNILMFPPLFFFAALYYTDVPSTLSVLVFHWYFVRSHTDVTSAMTRSLTLFLLGLLSLTFRQTNIFWVAVFPAGIVLVHNANRGHAVVKQSMHKGSGGFGDSLLSVAKTSWKMQALYDPSVTDASIDVYIKTVMSLVACLLSGATRPQFIFSTAVALAPYLALLATFAGFVLWNGGVVLGDKSNHIATLHLPQMLYIWPYLTFFSWPMIYPYLLVLPLSTIGRLPPLKNWDGSMLTFRRRYLLPRVWLLALAVAVSMAVVRFNTIVHPFTLADNRHYTFYVFRLLMRRWWVKYAVTPVYVLTGWACIQALGVAPDDVSSARVKDEFGPGKKESGKTASQPTPLPGEARDLNLPDGRKAATITFVLVWLAATSLQLITAPLVEPRYFILPWLYWRMHLPLRQSEQSVGRHRSTVAKYWHKYDHRLWLETAWAVLVRWVTCSIFIRWTFTWAQEPGKLQRFMW